MSQDKPTASPAALDFTSRQLLLASTVLAVAAFWALTRFLRDILTDTFLDLGPLGEYPCSTGWVPIAAAALVALLPQAFVYVQTWLKTGKRPSVYEVLLRIENRLIAGPNAAGANQPEAGAGVPQESAAAERPPAAAPEPPAAAHGAVRAA
jgi:hypothetical protein